MNRVLYQGQVYVLSRELPTHLELVSATTGELLQVPVGTPLARLQPPVRFFLPGLLPFDQRPPGFVAELQERRSKWLHDYHLRKATSKRRLKNPNGPSKAPRSAKGKAAAQVDSLIAQLLALPKPTEVT